MFGPGGGGFKLLSANPARGAKQIKLFQINKIKSKTFIGSRCVFDTIKCDCVTIACLLNIALHTHISSQLKELSIHFYKFVYKYKTNCSQSCFCVFPKINEENGENEENLYQNHVILLRFPVQLTLFSKLICISLSHSFRVLVELSL